MTQLAWMCIIPVHHSAPHTNVVCCANWLHSSTLHVDHLFLVHRSDRVGLSDPFCVLTPVRKDGTAVDSEAATSAVQSNTLNPTWNEVSVHVSLLAHTHTQHCCVLITLQC
jgi:hypothetical protein